MSRKNKAVELFEKYVVGRPIAVIYARLFDYTTDITKKKNCPFCSMEKERILEEGDFWNVINCDPKYPRHEHHILITPKRHVILKKELTGEELLELMKLSSKYEKEYNGFGLRREFGNGDSSVQHQHYHVLSLVK